MSGCVTHRAGEEREADPGYFTCSSCAEHLREWLTDGQTKDGQPANIPTLYVMLDTEPTRSGEQVRSNGFGSSPPGSVHIMAMRDRRSRHGMWREDGQVYIWREQKLEEGVYGPPFGSYVAKRDAWRGADGKLYPEADGHLSVVSRLISWCRLVVEERELEGSPRQEVCDACEFLDRHLDWICRQPWVDELYSDLAKLVGELRTATGDPPRPKVGKCIRVIDDDLNRCGAPLRAPTSGDSIRCRQCGHIYAGLDMVRVRLVNEREAS